MFNSASENIIVHLPIPFPNYEEVFIKKTDTSGKVLATSEILCLWKQKAEHTEDLTAAARNRKNQKNEGWRWYQFSAPDSSKTEIHERFYMAFISKT